MPTPNAIQYTLRHLLKVAFPTIDTTVELSPKGVSAHIASCHILFPLMDKDTFRLLMKGTLPMKILKTATNNEVPAFKFFEKDGHFSVENQQITIHYDLLTLSFMLLSRAEEVWNDQPRDPHGRFRFRNSLAAKYGFIHQPIIDEYALLLRQWVTECIPALSVAPRIPKKISTHDIDLISRFGSTYTNLHTLAADLLKYRDRKMLATSMAQFHACRRDELKDPYILSAEMLLDQDFAAGWQSIFFFKSLQKNDPDFTYNIFSTQAAHLIRTVEARGASVGLHGSYHSFDNISCFNKERIYLETVTGHGIDLGRQHFLRFHPHQTVGVWQKAGIKHDYTLGYAEQEGFRCGTCHPFPLYDLLNDSPTAIVEHPLIAMDGTFFQYQQYDLTTARSKIQQLMRYCAAVEGDFILLWHNTCVWREYQPWFLEVFQQVVRP